jgi:PAS domain S-box-containing protein
VSAAGLGVWEWNLSNDRVIWSAECYKMFRVKEFGGGIEDFLEFVIPEDRERLSEAARDSIKSREHFRIELRINDADGNLHWLSNLGTVEYDTENRPLRMIGTVQDVTEQKTAEDLIRESEENYRALIEASTLFTWTLDENGPSPEVYEWLSDLSGRKITTLENIIDIVHPDDLSDLEAIWKNAIENRQVLSIVTRFRSYEGGFRYLAIRGVQVFNQDGSFRKWIGTFNDITERKSAEDELRKSEAFNRAVLNSMTSNIAVLDPNGNVKALNRAWRELVQSYPNLERDSQFRVELGANYTEFCERNSSDFGKDARKAAKAIREVLAGTRDKYFLEYCCKLGGLSRWFYMLVAPLQTREGGAVVSHTDITNLKLAEEALKKHEAQLQLVADTVPTVIAYLDTERHFVFANEACRKWFRLSEGQIIGHHIQEVTGAEAYEQLESEIDSVLKGDTVKIERAAILDPSRYIYINYVPDIDRDGNITGFFLFIIDLTHNKVAEEQLRKSEEQLRQAQKLESIGRLAGGIAHDFNNMLTAINGYCELTLLRMSQDDPLRRNIEEIKKAGERSAALTNQLLTFSRRQILEVSTLDVNRIVEDSIVMLQRVIGEDVRIELDLEKELWSIEGDQSQLTQVLLNLVVNSRDAMPRGGTVTITTRNAVLDNRFVSRRPGSREGKFVCLSVADTGTGMDEETQRHIFEPFFTTKETGKGTGLGLSMVYGIVKQLNGYVWVNSLPDGGTTFDIYLPRIKVGAEIEAISSPTSEHRAGSENILLVEDEDIVRELSRQILESCGYNVFAATNGKAAIELFTKGDVVIDLLFTDVVMPEISGPELAEQLVAMRPGLKVLFASGYLEEPVPMLDRVGDNGNFIQKPFSYDQLVKKVRAILDVNTDD